MPLLLELEEQLTAEIWQQKVQQNALAFDDAERMALELLAELSPEGTIQPLRWQKNYRRITSSS